MEHSVVSNTVGEDVVPAEVNSVLRLVFFLLLPEVKVVVLPGAAVPEALALIVMGGSSGISPRNEEGEEDRRVSPELFLLLRRSFRFCINF